MSTSRKSRSQIKVAPTPEPVIALDALEDAAQEAVRDADVDAPDESSEQQKVFKLTQFIKELKSEHPTAKRFNIYFFTDRIQRVANPWSDQAATIYLKPALVLISLDGKPKMIANETFTTKFDTTNWGISFTEFATRTIDPTATMNVLKVLPEELEYKGAQYYKSKIMRPDASEKRLAQGIADQIHDQFPIFRRIFESRQTSTSAQSPETEVDDILARLKACL
jgi:hypothetical protein